MKILLFYSFTLFFTPSLLLANNDPAYYRTTKKWGYSGIIRVENNTAVVYTMGRYLDKAGSGYGILSADTLSQSGEHVFTGKAQELMLGGSKPKLTLRNGKKKEYDIVPPDHLSEVYAVLNNAYFLDHFFAQCDSLKKMYPLNHFSFRNGFSYWENMADKKTAPDRFKKMADEKLRFVWDSVTGINNYLITLADQLIDRLPAISYASLKDSLQLFPFESVYTNHYLRNVLNRCSVLQPEYFFRISEDFIQYRYEIFRTAEPDEKTITNLRSVPGHEYAKKDFFKYFRSARSVRK